MGLRVVPAPVRGDAVLRGGPVAETQVTDVTEATPEVRTVVVPLTPRQSLRPGVRPRVTTQGPTTVQEEGLEASAPRPPLRRHESRGTRARSGARTQHRRHGTSDTADDDSQTVLIDRSRLTHTTHPCHINHEGQTGRAGNPGVVEGSPSTVRRVNQ